MTDSGQEQARAESESEAQPRGVRAMALLRWILIAVLAVIAALSVAYSFGSSSSDTATTAAPQYYCPMHPQVVQDHPGECPICGMSLVPKEGGSTGAKGTGTPPSNAPKTSAAPMADSGAAARGVPGLVPVVLGPDRVQLIGIRTAPASVEPLVAELRTVGFVAPEEGKLARVQTRFSGWIAHLAVATTGQKVRRGQLLASIDNPDLLPAQQEFLTARRWSSGSAAPSAPPSPLGGSFEQDARGRLELLGMSRSEIDRIAKTGKPTRTVAVSAPIGGHVVSKNAVQGAYVQPGTVLFEIADLSKVWILADVYEYEIGRVAVGQAASVALGAYPNERFSGKVGFIHPTVDPGSRTLRVRIELENKELKLRPGMYGDVFIQLGAAEGLTIPAEALVDTGEHQYVFLAKEGGRFEPRLVRAGVRSGDKVQIVEGLAAGDKVVTTANFLVDSESRLRGAVAGASESGAAPAPQVSACDRDFDKAKFPDKYATCRQCELVHRGMGTMEEDCKKAILRPWR